jgi:hypothetical protein
MDELVRWLGEQLDEDERIAGKTTPDGRLAPADPIEFILAGQDVATAATEAAEQHIRQFADPARVLREIDAKRQMLAELLPEPKEPQTDSELHARSAHPAYEYRTTQGPRKQWDGADEPPAGEDGDPDPTWERNTDAGRDGWDRFDYTEESYWRRRLPAGEERRPQVPRWLRLLALPYADRPGYREEWRP